MPVNEQTRIEEVVDEQTEEVQIEGFENLGVLMNGNPSAGGRGLKLKWKGDSGNEDEGDGTIEFEDLGAERIDQIMALVRKESYVVLEGVYRASNELVRHDALDLEKRRPVGLMWHQDNHLLGDVQIVSQKMEGDRTPTAVVHFDVLKSVMAEHLDILKDRDIYHSEDEYNKMMVCLKDCGFDVELTKEMLELQKLNYYISVDSAVKQLFATIRFGVENLAFLDAVNKTLVDRGLVAINEYSDGVASTILFRHQDDIESFPFYHCAFYLPGSDFSQDMTIPVYASFRCRGLA